MRYFSLGQRAPNAEDSRAQVVLRLRDFLADAEPSHREEQQALGLSHAGVARQYLSRQRRADR